MSDLHGVVYTKSWAVRLVLDIAGYTDDKRLWEKIIVEPSCGHGSFLNEIIRRLLNAAKRDNVLDFDHIIGCIRSFDLDENAVNTSRGIAIAELEKVGFSTTTAAIIAETWICHDDYLLSERVPCDFVVGNPPYLRATEIPAESRDKYVSELSTMTKGCDIYIGFFQKGLEALRNIDGVLCYICADRWLQNQYGRNLRRLVAQEYHLDTLIRMHDVAAFEVDVSAYPAITKINYGNGSIKYADCASTFGDSNIYELEAWLNGEGHDYRSDSFSAALLNSPKEDAIIPLSEPQKIRTITSLMDKFPTIEETGVNMGIGLATGKDDVYIVSDSTIAEPDRMLPMFDMRNWRKYQNTENTWLVNPWNRDGTLANLVDYPRMRSYFERHRDVISARHVAQKNAHSWYRTIDKVNWNIFGIPMLLFPDMAMKAEPVYSDGTRYPCHNCYWLTSDNWDIKVLGGLLMSDTAESFIDALGVKMRGGTKRFQAQYLKLIRVPSPENITAETADKLRKAFEMNDRDAANKAALLAYGLEE